MHNTRIRFSEPPVDVRIGSAEHESPQPAVAPPPASAPAIPTPNPDQTAERLQTLADSLREGLEVLEERRQQSLDELRQVAVELSITIASHVIVAAIDEQQHGIVELVRQAVEDIETHDPVTVWLHPEDFDLFHDRTSAEASPWPAESDVRIQSDDSLTRGDCRVEGPDFGLITSVEQQLEDIRLSLLESLHASPVDRRTSAAAKLGWKRAPDRRSG